MKQIVTGGQMKLLDDYTIRKIGIPSLVLMERAALSVYRALVEEDFGIALVADTEAIRKRNIRILPLRDIHLVHTVYLAYLKDHYMIPAVRNFLQFIIKDGTHL